MNLQNSNNFPANTCYPSQNNSNIPSENSSKNKKFYSRTRFSPLEDQEIIRLVSIYGQNEWKQISRELKFHRTAKQCKDRYMNYLSPDIQNNEWTKEEDQTLIFNYFMYPNRWQILKEYLYNRSEISIKNRFRYLEKGCLKILRPYFNRSQKQIENNSDQIQVFTNMENALDKFKECKNDLFKSITNDATELYYKHNPKTKSTSKNKNY